LPWNKQAASSAPRIRPIHVSRLPWNNPNIQSKKALAGKSNEIANAAAIRKNA
jgi:hypothetical protein